MKNVLLINMFLTFMTINLNAQSVEWKSNLVDVLYAGYDNVLPLKFVDVDAAKVMFSVTGGELSQNDKGGYVWKSRTGGHSETLTAKVGNKVIGKFEMKFVRFPDPITETLPKNATLKNWVGIACVLPNVKLNPPAFIYSYMIQVTISGDVINLKNKGGELTAENRRQLKHLGRKASVVVTDVRAHCPGDKAGRRINDITIQ